MATIEIETHIGGIPAIVRAYVLPEQGDNWHDPYIPAHVDDMEILSMRGKPCAWREKRMTDADRQRIEQEALDAHAERQREYA